jgi:hypothetical protein
MAKPSRKPSKKPSVSALKELLEQMEESEYLRNVPEDVQRLTLIYADGQGLAVELDRGFPTPLVAEALLEVWDRTVRAKLVRRKTRPQWWVQILLPVAQSLTPLLAQYPDPMFLDAKGSLQRTAGRLMDEDWVTRLTGDRTVAREVVKDVSGRFIDPKTAKIKVTKTYDNWWKKGVEFLAQGIQQALAMPPTFGDPTEELRLPAHYVKRVEILAELRAVVLEAAKTGGLVAVTGLAGTGKSSTLAALVQDPETKDAFHDRIAAVEVTAEMSTVTLVRQFAARLGEPLLHWMEEAKQARVVLKEQMTGRLGLLVVDDVYASAILEGVRDLGPGVVVVLATRSLTVVDAMGIPSSRQVQIGAMKFPEARALAEQVSEGIAPEEEEAACEVLQLLEYHPYAVRLAAALARDNGWEATERVIRDKRARTVALRDLDEEYLNLWASLDAWWEGEKRLRRYLAVLGHLPLLSWYDRGTGMAVWRVSAGMADEIWGALARMQLVDVVDKGQGHYRMHWLVWDFARQKVKDLSLWDRLLLRFWVWRYPLQPERSGWQFWKVRIPKPETEVSWPLLSPQIPKMKKVRKIASLWWWLTNQEWPEGLRMAAGPEEWAMTAQARWRFRGAIALLATVGLAGTLGTLKISQSPNQLEIMRGHLLITLMLLGIWLVVPCLCLWVAIVAVIELRRMLWRRLKVHDPPLSGA